MYTLHSHTFYMPQLKRERVIKVLMPKDYNTSTRHYPVLYMHDGQNLFDPATAFASDWKIPATLNHQPLKRQVIIVGLYNGEIDRVNEYAPYKRGKNGGEGDAYVRFIIDTLKPFMDTTYRTLPQRETTMIAGSSMGGLISLYAGLKYGAIFGKIGVLSPSIWFNPKVLALAAQAPVKSKFYIAGSKTEFKGMETTLQQTYWTFKNAGFADELLRVVIRERGKHSEIMWSREFKKMLEWLSD